MPFLVASIGSALTDLGLEVHLNIHPIVEDGLGAKVSMMHIELESEVSEERRDVVITGLKSVLADVRSAVHAWPALRQKAEQMAGEAQTACVQCDSTEAEEAALFLRSLEDGNFVFLGYREYRIGPEAAQIVPSTGQGVLENDEVLVFDGLRALTQASPTVQAALNAPTSLLVAKSSRRATVYRPVPMDGIVLKIFDDSGSVTGLKLLLGLFTMTFHSRPSHEIPLLRHKVRRCLARSGLAPDSHDGQALRRILDSFPHDDLFQVDEQKLFDTALTVLHLRQRPRIGLLVLRDPFGRFATCLVYMPRDRYNAEIRRRATGILEQALAGRLMTDSTAFDEARLACLRVVLATPAGEAQEEADLAAIERQLVEAARSWWDRLGEALSKIHGRHAVAMLHRFGGAFPSSYTARHTAEQAARDIALVETVEGGAPLAVSLTGSGSVLRLKTLRADAPIALSDILPILENLGVRVITEIPDEVSPREGATFWIQDFLLERQAGKGEVLQQFEDGLRQVWSGIVENDGFNRLMLSAGLSIRQAVVLRAYCKLLRQAGSGFSQAYMEDTLNDHPELARSLVALFEAQFDPARPDAAEATRNITEQIAAELEQVENLDEDRILRAYLLLISKTLRTNFYQRNENGEPKPYLSFKLASREIDLLPLPRPLFEIFVYSPRMEGCHLRGGKVARGGIRWSDRKEDFRTEILGLMKAQMVKNAVIVPIGSKGGFVVKRPPAGAGREALMQEVVGCYKYLMSGLLDITDNLRGETVVPPRDVVRRDPDDPYLVVAADKGTATFSDIANGVARDYGFWLDDAFASGGSIGYDHKGMGITAKGAWEAVKRHFRELGTNIQTTDFTCVGVGDMSGDVFGNGMLLSRHIKLLAAFNHMHIFIDPDPDAATSWAERKRLFDLQRSTWEDYDKSKLSKGGGIYERRAKSIPLSPEARHALGIAEESLSPQALIQVLLRLDVDLLWFGGIGTYVKASTESQAEAGDRANDSLRIDAPMLRAKVIGEGANLAITQRARIQFALGGGRLNTDAIDNSAGVDTSDHEVNIKIGVGDLITAGLVPAESRAPFLASMTEEVEHLVLRDNYLQTLALTLAEARAPQELEAHARLMRGMEKAGRLDRAVEFLPDDEAIAQRAVAKRGLTRPEIAVLLAYAKNGFYDELLSSDFSDQDELRSELLAYFPQAMSKLGPNALTGHRLRREIIATSIANELVNRMGPGFVEETKARTAAAAGSIARAYLIVRDVFELEPVWQAIEALDNAARAAAQTQLMLAVSEAVEQAVRWFLLSGAALEIGARIREFQPGVRTLASHVVDLLPTTERTLKETRRSAYVEAGAPPDLADRVLVLNVLSTAMDIVQVHEETGRSILEVGRLYFGAGSALGLLTLRRQARSLPATTEWQRLVVDSLVDESYGQQRAVVRRMVADGVGGEGDGFDAWIDRKAGPGSPVYSVLSDIARAPAPDLAMLTVASQRIRTVVS
ncbi:MAG: NAD-glutamate dehydrogenase [Acetobacteraceae bacterium]|nr:NAD-glutamate dehydrogenase [Acetobacteraceae bacterium]